jgi:hypothetical protein
MRIKQIEMKDRPWNAIECSLGQAKILQRSGDDVVASTVRDDGKVEYWTWTVREEPEFVIRNGRKEYVD